MKDKRNLLLPAAWSSRRQDPNLVEMFIEALQAAKGEVFLTEDLASAFQAVEKIVEDISAKNIAINHEPPLDQLELREKEVHFVGLSEGDLKSFCAAADVGLTGAEAGLAETGTLALTSGPGKSRMVSLLPPVHIALLPTSSLVADIFSWHPPEDLPANLFFISGPSKTADIEQTLSVGVHGPKRFMVVLYHDE